MLSIEELKLQFNYDPETGIFTRISIRDSHGNLKSCNYEVVGHNGHRGYKRVSINGERYLLHKLAIFYVTGNYPVDEVDHLNGDTSDNRYTNLSYCGKSKNRLNLKLYSCSKTGIIGVRVRNGKFFAEAQKNKIRYFEGYFDNIEDAIIARDKMNRLLGFSENHGRQSESKT